MVNELKFLFFFVHPSKYHLFKLTVNSLIEDGHSVEILITSKDVLEPLLKNEGWHYRNIFPEGRKIKNLPAKVSAVINTFRTLFRIHKYCRGRKYDLFITDDLLTITGMYKKIPTILFQDDDIKAVPESFLLLKTTDYVLAPIWTDLGKYNIKKLSVIGFKQSAYLHPDYFKVDQNISAKYLDLTKKNFILRLVSLTATHDMGKTGLDNKRVLELITLLSMHGMVHISSERPLPDSLERYRLKIDSSDIIHVIASADLFISDSQTMSAEAGFLGTPYIRYNDFVGLISYLDVLENKYKLGYGIKTTEYEKLILTVKELLNNVNLKDENKMRLQAMLNDTEDLTEVMIKLFTGFPQSLEIFKNRKK